MASASETANWTTGQVVSNGSDAGVPRESLSTAIADIVSRMKGVDPTDGGFSLYEFMDPEAIDALFEHAQRREETEWRLEFDTGGESVVVRSDGFIRVRRSS